MVEHLESSTALGMTHEQLEAYVVEEGRELKRRVLQAHMVLRSAADRVVKVVKADGVALRSRSQPRARRLMSLVGEVTVPRLLCGAAGTTGLAPLDAGLNLPAESFSLGVRRRVAEEVAAGSGVAEMDRATTGAEGARASRSRARARGKTMSQYSTAALASRQRLGRDIRRSRLAVGCAGHPLTGRRVTHD
ncbi:MAG: hypothetical protein IT373_06920 [Polyangiaceae bacterium]|nr:hypothetical protein [Polyangiaceae bacterium]